MKQTLNIISTISILLFLGVYLLDIVFNIDFFSQYKIDNLLVIIFLISQLKYYQLDSKEKTNEINALKNQLNKYTNNLK